MPDKTLRGNAALQSMVMTDVDIPFCPTVLRELPTKIITYREARTSKDFDSWVCFYEFDQEFDSSRGIWYRPQEAFDILSHFKGIITPDFSTYADFPQSLKRWNTYRSRAFGYVAGKKGLQVINNVRWGGPETYDYMLAGIPKKSIVAIGTVGGSPNSIENRMRFEQGLIEMVSRLEPETILIYGSSNYQCIRKLESQGIAIIAFDGATSSYFKGARR